MARLGVPHIVVSIPRLITLFVIAGAVLGSTQLTGHALRSQPIHTQAVSLKNTVPYTTAPQTTAQVAPTQTPKSTAIIPQQAAVVPVTQTTTAAPVVTPTPAASVNDLSPVGSAPNASNTPGTGSSDSSSGQSTTSGSSTTPATTSYTSQNWSGYMMNSGKYTAVTGSWTVPKVSGTNGETTADATWIGIGGVTTKDLLQVGTQNTISPSGAVTSSAFYELLPHGSRTIASVPISAGDVITASVTEITVGQWKITIANKTTGQSYTAAVTYSSQLSSAEWIEEEPSTAAGHLVPLNSFSPVIFSNATAQSNNVPVNLLGGNAVPITLVTSGNAVVAAPSALANGDEGFTVTKQS